MRTRFNIVTSRQCTIGSSTPPATTLIFYVRMVASHIRPGIVGFVVNELFPSGISPFRRTFAPLSPQRKSLPL
jgi:hypothetical protein